MLIACFAAYLLMHSRLERGVDGHGGSDRDEALAMACASVMNGQNPYLQVTWAGNPLSPLPGEIALALPFAILADAALQTFAWMTFFFFSLQAVARSFDLALRLCAAALLLSPIVAHEVVTGGDLLANTLFVSVACCLLLRTARRETSWKSIVAALFLGATLSSRLHFALALPIALSSIGRARGARAALFHGGMISIGFAVTLLPFALRGELATLPFGAASRKLAPLEHVVPHITTIAFAVCAAISLALSHPGHKTEHASYRAIAFALLTPSLVATMLVGAGLGRIDFHPFGFYGQSGLAMALYAIAAEYAAARSS